MPSLETLLRYGRTGRYLRPIQVGNRVWRRFYHPAPDATAAPSLRAATAAWTHPPQRAASQPAPLLFRFLNQQHQLPAEGGWNDHQLPRLWLYNLHYFDERH